MIPAGIGYHACLLFFVYMIPVDYKIAKFSLIVYFAYLSLIISSYHFKKEWPGYTSIRKSIDLYTSHSGMFSLLISNISNEQHKSIFKIYSAITENMEDSLKPLRIHPKLSPFR